jgi:hypothetical protein
MEKAFCTDFSSVEIHNNEAAHGRASALRARAFTEGERIFFASGYYAPEWPEGARLLAHELAHVVQFRAAQAPKAAVHSHNSAAEAQASRMAANALGRGQVPEVPLPVTGTHLD